MKRNLNLIRDLLLVIEAADTPAVPHFHLNPFDADVQYHLRLLFEGGYVRGVGETEKGAVSVRLTWQGHELLELARHEEVWRRAMQYVDERAGGVSVAVLQKLLEQWSVLAADSIDWGIHRRYRTSAPEPQVVAPPKTHRVKDETAMPYLLHSSTRSGRVATETATNGNGNGSTGESGAVKPNGAATRPVYPWRNWNGLADTLPLYLL